MDDIYNFKTRTFYFMTKDKYIAHHYFAERYNGLDGYFNKQYKLVETPYLGCRINICTCRDNFLPLFFSHYPFDTFEKLEKFYQTCEPKNIQIYDNNRKRYGWDFFHYDAIYDIVKDIGKSSRGYKLVWDSKGIHLIPCPTAEAMLHTPISYIDYMKAKQNILKTIYAGVPDYSEDFKKDPHVSIEWTNEQYVL